MAASSSGDAELGNRLERLEAKLNDIDSASRRLKNTGRAMTVLITVIVLVLVWLLLSPFWRAKQNPKPYVEELQKAMETQMAPLLQKEGQLLVKDLEPIYKEKVETFQSTYAPEIMTLLETEASALVENLVVKVDEEMNIFLEEYQQKQLDLLRREMPGIDDPEKIDRFMKVAEGVSGRLVDELFSEHYDALIRLETAFASVEVSEEVANMSPEELEEHVSALILEYLSLRYSQIASGMDQAPADSIEVVSPASAEPAP